MHIKYYISGEECPPPTDRIWGKLKPFGSMGLLEKGDSGRSRGTDMGVLFSNLPRRINIGAGVEIISYVGNLRALRPISTLTAFRKGSTDFNFPQRYRVPWSSISKGSSMVEPETSADSYVLGVVRKGPRIVRVTRKKFWEYLLTSWSWTVSVPGRLLLWFTSEHPHTFTLYTYFIISAKQIPERETTG